MLLRKYVEGVPTLLHKADLPCRVQIWSSSLEVVATRPRVMYLSPDPDRCNPTEGTALPYMQRVDIDMEQGQSLYGWAYEAILANLSVLERT